MKPEIKQKWIEALESGEYEQGQHALRSEDNKFCCLGVLCDVAIESGLSMSVRNPQLGDAAFSYTYDGNAAFLPNSVNNWAGGITKLGKLMRMNDEGKTFKQIAKYIKESL